jgi:hypothetical protein
VFVGVVVDCLSYSFVFWGVAVHDLVDLVLCGVLSVYSR